ncbi:hypothetical protein HN51_044796, partial [Arachis hypogaea]
SSCAVEARGRATFLRGLTSASFRFHSTLKETSGIDPRVGTTRHVGIIAAAIERKCSNGHGGLNFSLIPHMASLRIRPFHGFPDETFSGESRWRRVINSAIAPPRDSE